MKWVHWFCDILKSQIAYRLNNYYDIILDDIYHTPLAQNNFGVGC